MGIFLGKPQSEQSLLSNHLNPAAVVAIVAQFTGSELHAQLLREWRYQETFSTSDAIYVFQANQQKIFEVGAHASLISNGTCVLNGSSAYAIVTADDVNWFIRGKPNCLTHIAYNKQSETELRQLLKQKLFPKKCLTCSIGTV